METACLRGCTIEFARHLATRRVYTRPRRRPHNGDDAGATDRALPAVSPRPRTAGRAHRKRGRRGHRRHRQRRPVPHPARPLHGRRTHRDDLERPRRDGRAELRRPDRGPQPQLRLGQPRRKHVPTFRRDLQQQPARRPALRGVRLRGPRFGDVRPRGTPRHRHQTADDRRRDLARERPRAGCRRDRGDRRRRPHPDDRRFRRRSRGPAVGRSGR